MCSTLGSTLARALGLAVWRSVRCSGWWLRLSTWWPARGPFVFRLENRRMILPGMQGRETEKCNLEVRLTSTYVLLAPCYEDATVRMIRWYFLFGLK